MTEIESRIERLMRLHERGLVSESELVGSFLLDVCSTPDVGDTKALMDVLPEQLAEAVSRRLVDLKKSDFEWHPFVIGDELNETELTRLRERLRTVYSHLVE